jgi:PPM family protein phosphatase
LLRSSDHIAFDFYSDSNSVSAFHKENQDSVFASRSKLVFAVADGVGGYLGAKEASQIAVDTIKDTPTDFDSEEVMASCLSEIAKRIKKRSRELGYEGMGTTLALAKILPEGMTTITANVGDSPIFLIKANANNSIASLYKDDSLRFVDPDNMWSINQYLGYDGRLNIHTKSAHYEKGDILLLCSDGISDNILGRSNNLSRLASLVRENRSAKTLIQIAMNTGLKSDDMTAMLVFL